MESNMLVIFYCNLNTKEGDEICVDLLGQERNLSYVECSKGRDENVLVMYDDTLILTNDEAILKSF